MNESDFEIEQSHGSSGDFHVESSHEAFPPIDKNMVAEDKRTFLGKPDLSNIPTFIHGIAFKQIINYLLTQPNVELEGALIGRHCRDIQDREFVEIVEFFPFFTSLAAPGSTEASEQEWSRARERVDEMRRGGGDVQIVGWLHSHPGMKPAPSDTDIETIEKHFKLPWQISLIIDPKRKRIGVFGYSKEAGVRNKGGLIGYDDGDNSRIKLIDYSYCTAQHF